MDSRNSRTGTPIPPITLISMGFFKLFTLKNYPFFQEGSGFDKPGEGGKKTRVILVGPEKFRLDCSMWQYEAVKSRFIDGAILRERGCPNGSLTMAHANKHPQYSRG